MIYPLPMGPPSMVFSSMRNGSSMSGICSCLIVLWSMKFPADPELIMARITEYSITVEMLHNGIGRKGEVL